MAQTSQNKKDLAQARTKTNFDITDMTNYLYGGAANVEQRRYIIDLIAREPIFNKDDWYVVQHMAVIVPQHLNRGAIT
jgi:acyl-CoA oxidase